MMVKFIKLLPKKEMVLYIIFALLYSCQGIVIPVIIQMAGHLDSGNSQDLIVFTFSGISLWVAMYAFMYIENILLRSIIRAFNVRLSGNILKNYAVFPKKNSDSELCSLLTQDLGIVDQEVPSIISYLTSVGCLCPSICYLSAQTKSYCG